MPENSPRQRVIVYIDGFNLYFGLRESGLRRFYWLNLQLLAENLLRPNQELAFTKYFTARIAGSRDGHSTAKKQWLQAKRKRQSDYLEALSTLLNFRCFEGHYLGKDIQCRNCGASWRKHEEKMTDVQIATQMLVDAYNDSFDAAIVMSADSDLVPPTLAIREAFPDKRIVVAFPPGRSSVELKRAANASFTIGRATLAKSQFPDKVQKLDGYLLMRPDKWR